MAVYVFSDIHGHLAPLKRAFDQIDLTDDDRIYCLGDMIDRGPDPVGVIKFVRSLPNVTVLQGNHEDLMLAYATHPFNEEHAMNWRINGGTVTASQFAEMDPDEIDDILAWIRSLPRWAYTQVNKRFYIFVHAGIRPHVIETPKNWTDESIRTFMEAQEDEDLVWIREDFWSEPTGLIGEDGKGPIVVAGHTPTPYLIAMTNDINRSVKNSDGFAQMVQVGAQSNVAGVPDRFDIDSAAAGGPGFGQVTILRLDDGKEFVEPILDGE